MPTLVQFGAGNIGRGFIAPTFAGAGWTVCFVDIDRPRIAALAQRGRYRVSEVDNRGERAVKVAPVTGLMADDTAAVAAAIAACDLAATAVGLGALKHLGANLAAGLMQRIAAGRTLDILVCENGVRAPAILRAAILAHVPQADRQRADAALGLIRTSIGRMIPAATGDDLLDLRVEPYAALPVERAAFKGPVPQVPNLKAKANFDLVLQQKLYLHNLTHACLAYAGHLAGRATIPDCMADPQLVAGALAAGGEAAEALARQHGGTDAERLAIRNECDALVRDLMERYRNRALSDPVARVARDPWRKLAADDRLVGAARLCLAEGVAPSAIVHHLVLACRYSPADDEPRAAEWRALQAAGLRAQLAAVAGLAEEDPLMAAALLAHRRLEAARRMRTAGLVLLEDEEQRLEIADFGLGRYDRFGLAIHVYVNTARCCAKELMLLPGQTCPEHRHPPVGGEPGKEETFRVRQGEVHLFLPEPADDPAAKAFALALLPQDKHGTVTAFRHVHLGPGDQCTLPPDTLHWFTAGPEGAVVSEFSTRSRDEADVFTDPAIRRVPSRVLQKHPAGG